MNDRGLTQVFVECQAAGCASVLQVVVPSTHRQGNGEVLVRCGKCRRLLRVQLPEELLEPALPPLVPDPTAHMARSPHSSSSSQGQLQPFPSQGPPPPAPPSGPHGGWQQQQQQPSRATPGSSLRPVPTTHQHPDPWAPLPQQHHRDVGPRYTTGHMQGGPTAQHWQLPESLQQQQQQQQHLNQNQYYQQQQDHVYQDVIPCTADQGPLAPGRGVRRRRPTNAYQEFIRDEMKRLKLSNPGMDHQAAFKMAASTWVTSGAKAAADQAKQDQALAEAARDQRLAQHEIIAQQMLNYGSMVGQHASTTHNLPTAAPTEAPPAQQPLDSSGLAMQGPQAAPGQQLQACGALYTGLTTHPLEFPIDQFMPLGVAAGDASSGLAFQQPGAAGALDTGWKGHSQQAAAAAAAASSAAGLSSEWMSAGQQADWAAVHERQQQQQVAPAVNRLAAPQIPPHATAEAADMTMVAATAAAATAAAAAEDPGAVATGGAAVCPEAHLAGDTAGTAAGNRPQQVMAEEPSQCQTPEVSSLASPSTTVPPPPPRLGSDSANNNQHAAPQPQPAAAAAAALAPVAATATPSLALTAAGAVITPNITTSSSSHEQGRPGCEPLTLQETWEALCMKHAPSTPHSQPQQQHNPAAKPALLPGGVSTGPPGQLLQESPPGQTQTADCLAPAAVIAAGGTSTQPDEDLLVTAAHQNPRTAVAGAGSSPADDALAVQQRGTQSQQLQVANVLQGAGGATVCPATGLQGGLGAGPAVPKLSPAAVAEPVGQKPAAAPGAAAAPVLNSEGSSLASWSAGLSHVQTGTAEPDSSGAPAMASPGSLSGAAASTPPSILRHNSAPITTGFLPRQSKAVGYSITTAGP